MIDEEKVLKTTLTIAEASQFIISMGADFVKKAT
jgi:deoxyribose-phosphate aldolase